LGYPWLEVIVPSLEGIDGGHRRPFSFRIDTSSAVFEAWNFSRSLFLYHFMVGRER
jgi:hypothetical protein